MSKQIVSEQDIAAFAVEHTPHGEPQLVGLYASKRRRWPGASFTNALGLLHVAIMSGFGAARSNVWSEFFANTSRIVVAELHYVNAETGNVETYLRSDISHIRVRRGLTTYTVYVHLKDGSKNKYVIGQLMLGHPTHKQRLQQLLEVLASYPSSPQQ